MINTSKKDIRKQKRKWRVRKKVSGTVQKPRVSFFRSNVALYVQVIDDVNGATLCSAGSKEGKNMEVAKKVGVELAKSMKAAKINEAVFDRNGNKYHGVLKVFVETLRENGIKI